MGSWLLIILNFLRLKFKYIFNLFFSLHCSPSLTLIYVCICACIYLFIIFFFPHSRSLFHCLLERRERGRERNIDVREKQWLAVSRMRWCQGLYLSWLGMELPYDPAIPLLGIYLKKSKTLIWKRMHPYVHCSVM